MSLTKFPSGLSSFGIPQIGGLLNVPFVSPGAKFAQVVFVDPSRGNDGNAGDDPSIPVATFARAQALVDSGVGAMIFLAPDSYVENFVVTKDYLHIIGQMTPRYAWPDIVPASGKALYQQAAQGLILHRLRFAAPAADTDLLLIEGNGNIFDSCIFDGDAAQGNAKGLVRLKGNASDDSYTASEGLIRRCLFRGSGGQGLIFDTGASPGNGVGVTDALVEDNIFVANDQEDVATQDTGTGTYSVQKTELRRNFFQSKNKTTYVDLTTTNGGAASDQTGAINGNYFASDVITAGTTVKMVGTGFTFTGNYYTVGIKDGSGLD